MKIELEFRDDLNAYQCSDMMKLAIQTYENLSGAAVLQAEGYETIYCRLDDGVDILETEVDLKYQMLNFIQAEYDTADDEDDRILMAAVLEWLESNRF